MINPGDRGDVVTVVTNTLHRLGFLPAVTDVFTKEVEIALRAFQQERGLTVSGIANEITLGALEEARWKLGDRTLFFNNGEGQLLMRGDDVATLQNRLIDMGFDSSSMLSFTIFIFAPYSLAISSRIGATARQGPHHSAQNSTNTGVALLERHRQN